MSRLEELRTMLRSCGVADSWRRLAPCDVLLVRGDVDCGYTFRSKAYSPLLDSMGELLSARGLRVSAVALPYARLVGDLARFSPASYNRAAAATAWLGTVARLGGSGVRDRWIARRNEKQWTDILSVSRPRYIIGINPQTVLCRVARRMGIATYDLQHGVIASGNYWYDERGRDDFDRRDLPTGILCWDEPSAAALRHWAGKAGVDVQVIGNPWFSRFLRPQHDDALVQEEMSAAHWPHTDRPTIVVSLQWGIGTFHYPQPGFNGVMVDALEAAIRTTADRYDWLLRLHPIQMQGREQAAVEQYLRGAFGGLDGVEWRHSSRMALPLVLSRAALHITDCSSVVIEAGWLGVKSALLNAKLSSGQPFENVYTYERSVGLADLVPRDAQGIRDWIARNLDAPRPQQTAPHYRDAVSEFIDLIQERCRMQGTAPQVA
jgi:hypothetical protein